MVTTGSSATFGSGSYPTGTLRRAAASLGVQHREEPCTVCAHTGADHTGVPGHRGIPEGAG